MLTTRTRIKVLSELAASQKTHSPSHHDTEAVFEEEDEEVVEKRERRRQKIRNELFETEKTYLHHLDLAIKFFEFPLRFNCLVSEPDHSKLFANLEQIRDVNLKLLEQMEQTTIGSAFKFLGPFLKLYSMYANNYGQASSTLQENLQKNGDFAKFVQKQEGRNELMGLKLGALLITPVQRVPRYKLLLVDLLENTSPYHHDYQYLKEAAKQIGDIALHINEHVKKHENFMKMLSIQKSFDNSAPKILAPGREFVKEGTLKKVSRRGGRPQERMFFLFSDMMLYGKPRLIDSGNSSYSCCCMLPLRHCQVERVLGSLQTSDGTGLFKILCKDESLLLHCQDGEEAKDWIEAIETAIKKLNLNRQTLRKPSSNNMPVRGKSLIRMNKNDLKRKGLHQERKATDSPKSKKGRLFSWGSGRDPASNNSVSNLRRDVLEAPVIQMESAYKEYEENNEVNLDECEEENMHTLAEEEENRLDNSDVYDDPFDTPQASRGNCDEAGEDANFRLSGYYDDKSPSCSPTNPGRSYQREPETRADNSLKENNRDQNYSSQPWINPRFNMKEENKSSCTPWPFRKVSRVTSSIGGMMDSVRSGNRCVIM